MSYTVSVVIPVFNRQELVNRAISSVIKQSYTPLEIIVVDDGSSPTLDASKLPKFKKIKVIRSPQNQGVSAARNQGIRKASGDWIAFLDSDDEWVCQKLEKQILYLQENKSIFAIHSGEKWIRNGNEVLPPKYLDKTSHSLWERSLKHCLICPSSVLLHKSIFASIGLFNENLPVCEDYELWLKLLLQHELGFVSEKLVIKHGGHPDQLSTKTWGMDRFRIEALKNIIMHPRISEPQCSLAKKVLVDKCMILANGSEKRNKPEDASKYRHLAQTYASDSPIIRAQN